jgi:prepilin-type N-terminal cleavage/methylation domain-containing protein
MTLFKSKFLGSQRGFTLIELLVTIAIIGALSALLIANLVGARTRAADVKKKAELESLKSALRLYYNDYQSYPLGSGLINTGTNLMPGDLFAIDDTTYMKALPDNYFYYNTANDTYLLITKIGNLSDTALEKNYERCCNPLRPNCPATLTNEYILCED